MGSHTLEVLDADQRIILKEIIMKTGRFELDLSNPE
jgi:hypothetical protein